MTILHLGVTEIPYANAPSEARGAKVTSGEETTGDVAEWLENKYHVMENFFELHESEVTGALETSLSGALETLLMGGPVSVDPFGSAAGEIETAFHKFIESAEMETIGYPGVPTKAALEGVNHRLKSGHGPRRPSFRDTGLYESSFKAWVD